MKTVMMTVEELHAKIETMSNKQKNKLYVLNPDLFDAWEPADYRAIHMYFSVPPFWTCTTKEDYKEREKKYQEAVKDCDEYTKYYNKHMVKTVRGGGFESKTKRYR